MIAGLVNVSLHYCRFNCPLAGCAAASFSHGTFSWWTAYLTAGTVYYDRGLLDPHRHRACRKMLGADGGCGEDARAYVAAHVPSEWIAV